MKKFFPLMALLVVVATTFEACKKYPDGPAFSFRSAKGRLAGDWKVVKYTAGGEDQLNWSEMESGVCWSGLTKTWTDTDVSDIEISFDKDGDLTWKHTGTSSYGYLDAMNCLVEMETETYTSAYPGEWEFGDKKKELEITFSSGGLSFVQVYEIVRLTNKEMKLEGLFNGVKEELTLEAE